VNERLQTAALQNAGTTEELIGVLTAISVVSGRMAMKLAILKRRTARRGGEWPHARGATQPAAHARQSHPL
jgi:hypothetical protein